MQIRKQLGLFSFIILVVGSAFLLLNIRQVSFALLDWWAVRNYDPPAVIAQMVDDTGMSDRGQYLFYAGQPQLLDKSEFNSRCPLTEETFVLGCYSSRDIFLLDVEDPQLEPVEAVTSAHEMLHGVWERHSDDKQQELAKELVAAFEDINDKRLNELIDNYRDGTARDEDVIPNELHSILATEIRELPESLEKYYAEYFTDRQKVVTLFESYEEVFANIEQQIDDLESDIAGLKERIESLESQIQSVKNELEALNAEMKKDSDAGRVNEFNSKIPRQNALVKEFNTLVSSYNASIKQHNEKVAKRNTLATQQNDLIKSIDSKF